MGSVLSQFGSIDCTSVMAAYMKSAIDELGLVYYVVCSAANDAAQLVTFAQTPVIQHFSPSIIYHYVYTFI